MLEHLLYNQMFENATWILTDKDKVVTEYTSREMEALIVSAYVDYHNKKYSQERSERNISEGDVSVRYLHLSGCEIFRHKEKYNIEAVSYTDIFPGYEIECYDYRYQCPDCNYLLDETKRKDEEPPEYAFCSKCLIAVSMEKYRTGG